MIGIGLLIGFINFIVGLIPVVNLFAFLIYPLVTIPLLTISYFVLYEKLRDLNGKPISNQPNKPFISVILFALALIVFLILVVLAYAVPNIIKNYSRQPTSHTIPSTQNNNSTVTNTFPTSPSQFRTSSNTQNISDCTSSTYEKVENKDMTNIQNAVIAYTKNHGMFPKNIPLIGTPEKEISSDGADICSDLIPAYLSALPESPCINNGISITSCSSNYDTGYEVGLEKVGTQTAIVVDWVNPEIRSGNSTNKQSPTSATPSTVTAQTEPYPNITIYPNAPIGFYAHDLDGKCCAYRGGCRNGSCGNFCVELVDESYCTKVSSTP